MLTASDITVFPRAGVTVVELPGVGPVAFGRSGTIQVPPAGCRSTAPPEPAPAAPVAGQMESLPMPSLGTAFGPRVAGQATTHSLADLASASAHAAEPPPKSAPSPVNSTSEFVELEEACTLSGRRPRTIRNLLYAKDPLLLAARLPGKGYRFNRGRFLKWVEERPDYARLPGVKEARRKKANRKV